ncbi:uncharacterized protein LOC122061915 [Macadamia integrifolia]|uniref:uncharacterized protein LOC122061915 n=1 Tax=Macadamia integrifolia TaxID=60698 RepID=UPI001C52DF36|nr:uncharacterized protein LOC122061915 [Macadamia integrifolia]
MTRRSSVLWSFFEVETSDGVKLHRRIFKPRGEPEDNLIIVQVSRPGELLSWVLPKPVVLSLSANGFVKICPLIGFCWWVLLQVLQFQKLLFIGYKKLLASEFGVPLWDGYADVKQFVNKLKSVTGRAETHLIEGVGHR